MYYQTGYDDIMKILVPWYGDVWDGDVYIHMKM